MPDCAAKIEVASPAGPPPTIKISGTCSSTIVAASEETSRQGSLDVKRQQRVGRLRRSARSWTVRHREKLARLASGTKRTLRYGIEQAQHVLSSLRVEMIGQDGVRSGRVCSEFQF